jgi:hypothetical protein
MHADARPGQDHGTASERSMAWARRARSDGDGRARRVERRASRAAGAQDERRGSGGARQGCVGAPKGCGRGGLAVGSGPAGPRAEQAHVTAAPKRASATAAATISSASAVGGQRPSSSGASPFTAHAALTALRAAFAPWIRRAPGRAASTPRHDAPSSHRAACS